MKTSNDLITWLVGDGRLLGDETAIVTGYCEGLVQLGVPLTRARIAQRYSNPLIAAWGIIWSPQAAEKYMVRTTVLDTSAWKGSPFEHVVTTRTPLHKRLMDMDLSKEHTLYRELTETGVTDFLAVPLEYGDGAVQGTSYSTTHADGFTDAHVQLIEETRFALAAALEPIAMRQSQKSLLRTYLGNGPANEIAHGHIKRGEHKTVPAAILVADLRGFTAKSESLGEEQLLSVMGDYFEMVVGPVQEAGGDVLKFMGDGVLAVFEDLDGSGAACRAAVTAAGAAIERLEAYNAATRDTGREELAFVIGVDFGDVTYGNIGAPDRLDFTVVGPAVNVASRVQEMCKVLGEPVLVTEDVARHVKTGLASIGAHDVRGVQAPVKVFRRAGL